MGIASDTGDVLKALLKNCGKTDCGKTAESRWYYKRLEKQRKLSIKNQWRELFYDEDYNAVDYLTTFVKNDNKWALIPTSSHFDQLMRMQMYFKTGKFYLLQKHNLPNDIMKVRINPILYEDFCKNYYKYLEGGAQV